MEGGKKDFSMHADAVSSEQTHIYFWISFPSLSEHLNRESSNITMLAPACLHSDHTNTVNTQGREGQQREVNRSLRLPFASLFTPRTYSSPFSIFLQCPLYVSLNRWQMTVFSSVFEPDCNTVSIHRTMHIIAIIECVERATPVYVKISALSEVLHTRAFYLYIYTLNVTDQMGQDTRGGVPKDFKKCSWHELEDKHIVHVTSRISDPVFV